MRFYLLSFLLVFSLQLKAQDKPTKILTLGTFHFNFPNNDFVKTEELNQIDIFKPKYQDEIKGIVKSLENFKPSIIIIECQASKQHIIDSLYTSYLNGEHELKRDERRQIGFRLAKERGIKKLYCVDEWGDLNQQVNQVLSGRDSIGKKKFEEYYQRDAEASKKYNPQTIFKEEGILPELIRLNNPEHIKMSLGNYLVGPFKYESKERDFFGVNFETGRWFNRNLKIFRNIQRIDFHKEDKILVIYGSGHLNILNLLFETSPEFKLMNTNKFLR